MMANAMVSSAAGHAAQLTGLYRFLTVGAYDEGMFEGKLPSCPPKAVAAFATGDGDSLREMNWSDLRARLEAARDLRTILGLSGDNEPASFDGPFALHIAQLPDGKLAVNPSDSGNGKGTCAMIDALQDAANGSAPRK